MSCPVHAPAFSSRARFLRPGSFDVWGRLAGLFLLLLSLSACVDGRDLDQPPPPLGDFSLGHNVVIAPNLTKGPLSRDATAEEWIVAVEKAMNDRFGRYDGERFYHFGISVEGYVLAQVGVPLVLQPKSVVIFRITVWDDARGARMNLEPKEITVLEAISKESFAGSGLTQTREQQLENLAILAAKQVEQWLVEQNRDAGWFEGFVPEGADQDALLADALTDVGIEALTEEGAEASATDTVNTDTGNVERETLEPLVAPGLDQAPEDPELETASETSVNPTQDAGLGTAAETTEDSAAEIASETEPASP